VPYPWKAPVYGLWPS